MEFITNLEEFEGPIELLLYLVRREEVEIVDFPISKITREYLNFINGIKIIDFNEAGDFIKYASYLVEIKAKAIMKNGEPENIESVEELKKNLLLYKKYIERADFLKEKERISSQMYKRPKFEEFYKINANINEIIEGLKMIKKVENYNPPTSIIWHIERIIHKLKLKIEKLNFFPLWKSMKGASYSEKVGTFFGLLEIIREGFARAIQNERFGEIWVKKR